ncbi:hypothetical protein FQN54_005644 [Arachnomyces sp. PD_36]|nr:hypothetical protein FQN54_005644 [Arachnomyces sp. PD_36]
MFVANEIHLMIVQNLSPKDRKAYRLVSRQCNHVCRPKQWEKIILHSKAERLKRQIKAAEEFTWKGCDPTVSHEDGAVGWLKTTPFIHRLNICLTLKDEVMELQEEALRHIAPVLSLKTLSFKRPSLTYVLPHTDIYLLPLSEMMTTNTVSLIDLDDFARNHPTRIRSFDFVADKRKQTPLQGPSMVLEHLTNLKDLKIHFASTVKYHQQPDFVIPDSVTDISIIGPLNKRVGADDFLHSAALQLLPARLTRLNIKTEVITYVDLNKMVSLPNLEILGLIVRMFAPHPDMINPNAEPFPDYNKSKGLRYFGLHIQEPHLQGPYINSILRSAPNLERLSIRWFIPEDISILPEFCPKLKLLNLQYPHPHYPPQRDLVYLEMFRDTLPRFRKLNSAHLVFHESTRVESLSVIKCAVQCPVLETVILEERDPVDVPQKLPMNTENLEMGSLLDAPTSRLENWPREMVISGVGVRGDMAEIRRMYAEMPLSRKVLGGWVIPGY